MSTTLITPVTELTHRAVAMLRAVDQGRSEISCSSEPDLYVDGLCCDYVTAHQLAQGGIIRPVRPALAGRRVPAVLTAAGREALTAATQGLVSYARAS